MNISQGISHTKIRSVAAVLITVTAFLICSIGTASAQGVNGLLGVIPGFPQVNSSGELGQQCSYDSGTMTLTIETTPTLYFPDANTLNFINDGLLTLTATVDPAGNFLSGSFAITGTTTGGLGDPLLSGDVIEMGLENSNPNPEATDRGDFRIMPTGGSILTDPNWPPNSEIVATLRMELSNYDGSLASDWACGQANLIVGPSPTLIEVEIDVQPGDDPENPSCLNIDGHGTIPVAILGSATFDVTEINIESKDPPLLFAGLKVAITGGGSKQCATEDSNGDTFLDLVCHFENDPARWAPDSDTAATLIGQLLESFGGTPIQGTDGICLVPRKKSSSADPAFLALLSLFVLLRRRRQR